MDATLSNDQVNVQVFSYKPELNDPSVILYSVSITTKNGNSWLVEKRFSQFDKLHQELKQYFGNTLPSLPKKSYLTFFVGKSHDDIEERKNGLDSYLKNLVVRKEVFNSLPLREFLELDKNYSEAVVNPPSMICEIKGFLHAVRDFHISGDQGVMFVLSADSNVLTRLDAYMTNMKMPWESEQNNQAIIPVSYAECWVQQESGEFERVWTKAYNSQAICMFWESRTCTLLVGLDSGSINLLVVPQKDNNFKKYDESIEIEQHNDRVMGVYYDPERNLIHSISKDRKYRVLALEKSALVADYEPGLFELTHLLVSTERKRAFIGDKCGGLYIFDIASLKPQAIINLQTTIKSIRGLAIDSNKNYLFAVGFEEGDFIVFDIGKPGKESYTKEVAQMKNKPKSREIAWSGSRGEIYVGNEDGTVTIWDAKTVAPIYVIKAHEECITKLVWMEAELTLLTASKDKLIKAWRMPGSWRDKKIVEQEERERMIAEKTKTIVQTQQKVKKAEIDSDNEDELNSWHQ